MARITGPAKVFSEERSTDHERPGSRTDPVLLADAAARMGGRKRPRLQRPRTRSERDLPRRGYSRTEAAKITGVDLALFDRAVASGLLPQPRMLGTKKVWDIVELNRAFDALPHLNDAVIDQCQRGRSFAAVTSAVGVALPEGEVNSWGRKVMLALAERPAGAALAHEVSGAGNGTIGRLCAAGLITASVETDPKLQLTTRGRAWLRERIEATATSAGT